MSESEIIQIKSKLQNHPENLTLYQRLSQLQLHLPKYEECIQTCDHIISKFGPDSEAYHYKGYCKLALGDYQSAIVSLGESLKLNPENAHVNMLLGNAYLYNKEYEKALDHYNLGLNFNSNLDYGHTGKAGALCNLGRFDEAIDAYNSALKIKPDSLDNLEGKGCAYFNMGDYENAINVFEAYLKQKEDSCYMMFLKGVALKMNNKPEEALPLLRKAKQMLSSGNIQNIRPDQLNYMNLMLDKNLQSTEQIVNMNEKMKKMENTHDEKAKKVMEEYQTNIKKINDNEAKIVKDNFSTTNKMTNEEKQKLTKENDDRIRQLEEIIKKLSVDLEKNNQDDERRAKEFKEELDNKMDNYTNIIKKKVDSLKIDENKRTNITDYYFAFLNTFSSAYSNSQIVEDGSVQLDTGNTGIDLLSKLVSFIPVVGDMASEGITKLNDFLTTIDIKKRARKYKNLFASPSQLELIVGKAFVNTIGSEEYIVDEIIDINQSSEYLYTLDKLKKKYEELDQIVDERLYGKKYVNDSYKLGVEDANEIIGYICGDEKINMINIEFELEAIWKGLFMNKKNRRNVQPVAKKNNDESKSNCSCSCRII